jgi:sarcosine oxidase
VLGLERFDVPHEYGSSHGITRIIRLAYYEHTAYVPLLHRAYELWRDLEAAAGEQLLHVTGAVDGGPGIFEGSLRSCLDHDLPHEVMDGRELAARCPGYRLPQETQVLFQRDGGFLLPERCVVAHVEQALPHGAVVRARERVLEWDDAGDVVHVRTERGEYEAERLVVTAGAWAAEVARLPGLVQAERQVLAWFQPVGPELFAPARFPVFNLQVDEGHFYGFPAHGIPGFKLGRYHHLGEQVAADAFDREPNARDEAVLRAFTERYFPDAAGPTVALKTCLFENSPDEHFILDRHPESERVVVGAGFSGHGFKFCSVVGEILADLTVDGWTAHEIEFLRLSRFDDKVPGTVS